MFKVALIGCGNISNGHMDAIDTIDDAKIVAVCDISEENLKKACERTGAVGYNDYKELVKNEELDLVVINLPHFLHCEVVCYCAELGINVFVEKPLGINSEECEKMIDACKKANVLFWVGHLQRYMPINSFAKELIDSGEYGELIGFYETRNGEYFTERRPKWFATKALSGGGITMNLGAHFLDKIKYFSDSNIAEISGSIHMHEGLDCEDAVQAFIKMENGVVGTFNLIGYTSQYLYEYNLYLSNGEIRVVVDLEESVTYAKKGEKFVTKVFNGPSGMTFQIQDVIAHLREGKKEALIGGEYGLDIIRAIRRLYGDEK